MWASAVAASSSFSLLTPFTFNRGRGHFCRAKALPFQNHHQEEDVEENNNNNTEKKKKVVVVGSGWAGLASAHHLSKQGFDVTVLEPGTCPAGEVGLRGFWSPYSNIFSVVDELGLQPFTKRTGLDLYTSDGIEAEFPIFQDLPRLPAPFGALFYPQFLRLSWADRLTAIPLMAAVIDFDNTDTAWRKYDTASARGLVKQFGFSERLYHEAFEPLLQAGLFAPAEQCSAAATLGMLYYYVLAHQQNFGVQWCRGSVQEKILIPWLESLKQKGCKFVENRRVTDFILDKDGICISGVVSGQEKFEADAVILAVGVSALQSIIMSSSVLQLQQEFLNVLNLAATDVISVKLWLDRKVKLPKASNVCSGFDDSIGWTFFELNKIYDEYKDEACMIIEAEFYFANLLLPLKDEQILAKVTSNLSRCIKEFEEATVLQQTITRLPKSATHFFPGSYQYMMRGSTNFPNLFMAGDWIVTRHGSWSKEKAYVTGLEAANRVVDYLGEGDFARIIPVEEDEPHIERLRELNRRVNELSSQLPFYGFFLN